MALQTKTVSTGDYAWRSWSNGYVISLTLTEESVDVKANTSQVSYLFTVSNTENNRFYSGDYTWDISIGGQSISVSNFYFDLRTNFTTQTIASGVLTVQHNADGLLNMPYTVSIPNVQNWNSYGPPAMTLTGTWALTRIPRAASVSCPSGIIGSSVDVAINPTDAYFTYRLSYMFGSDSGVIAEKTTQTVVPWVIPMHFYDLMPNERKVKGTIVCTTYSGDQEVGNTSCSFYASVDPQVGKPSVSGNILDINPATLALTGDANQLVRYCSTAQVTGVCSPGMGACITSYTMTYSGVAHTENPAILYWVEKDNFRFVVKDSRDYSASVTVTKPMVPYIKLTCSLSNNKPDGDGNMTVHALGSYYNGSFGAQSNTLTVLYRYKEKGGQYGQWIPMDITLGVRTYNAYAELTGLDYKKVYIFQAQAVDKLATVDSAEYTARATPVFDWDEDDFNVNGTFKINNQPVADYIVSQGSSGAWQYRKWASGLAECWCSGISATQSTVNFPFGFQDEPIVNVTVNPRQSPYDNAWVMLQMLKFSRVDDSPQGLYDGIELTYCKSDAASISAAMTSIYVIGKWK